MPRWSNAAASAPPWATFGAFFFFVAPVRSTAAPEAPAAPAPASIGAFFFFVVVVVASMV